MRLRCSNGLRICLTLVLAAPAALDAATLCTPGSGPTLPHPILFVAQFPIAADFATIGSAFANHGARVSEAGRGGDLYLRYPDGTLCNLTREAGYGGAGVFQGANAIAVRDPAVHWDGTRALFSMVIGAPTRRYEVTTEHWQLYEVTGLGPGQPAVVTPVPNQPAGFNNLTPLYVPGGRIAFTSDRPRNGATHLYPQRDEYESTPTNTGLWSLDPATGDLALLDHAPSGDFTPILDSFGRLIFTRWDHLQRDQQALGYWEAGTALTPGLVREIQNWDPDELVSYDGSLWELSPVEVRARPQPPARTSALPGPEAQVFAEAGVDVGVFQDDLRDRGLALIVSRDVTTRDAADRQQPFNLAVAGGTAHTTGDGGTVYEVAYLQLFQGDQIRGMGGTASPEPGRRVLAQTLHDPAADNPPAPQGPPGSVALGADGSMAALVPARRAMTWQLTGAAGAPVVRERYWLTFQPGEIRVCTSCHGLNSVDQAGQPPPLNAPAALRTLLAYWKSTPLFADGFESGNVAAWSAAVGN